MPPTTAKRRTACPRAAPCSSTRTGLSSGARRPSMRGFGGSSMPFAHRARGLLVRRVIRTSGRPNRQRTTWRCSASSPAGPRLEMTLDAQPAVLVGMRRAVARWLSVHGLDRQTVLEVVAAAISEASNNAIEHAYGPRDATFVLELKLSEDEEDMRRRQQSRVVAPAMRPCPWSRTRPPGRADGPRRHRAQRTGHPRRDDQENAPMLEMSDSVAFHWRSCPRTSSR